jgi:hypothetical protein
MAENLPDTTGPDQAAIVQTGAPPASPPGYEFPTTSSMMHSRTLPSRARQ